MAAKKTMAQKIASAKSAASKIPVEKIVVTNSRGSKGVDVAIKSGVAKTDPTYKAPKEGPLKESQRASATKAGWAGAKVAAKTGEKAKVVASRIQTDRSRTAARAKAIEKRLASKKPLTASEKAFIKNQKEKAKATKRTGVYPNTAN